MTKTVKLKGDRIAEVKPLTARDFFEFNEQAQKLGASAASLGLFLKAVTVNGEPVTPENINQLLRFRDRLKVDAFVFKVDGEPKINDGADQFFDSEDFTLPDGRRIEVLDPDGSLYDSYVATQGKSYSKALALAFKGLFTIDGKPLDDQALDTLYPEGLGFEAAALLLPYLVSFFQPSQAP